MEADPREVLAEWAASFRSAFERTHPYPSEVQVALRLRREPHLELDVAELARAAGVSRAGLVRRFSQRYGRSVAAYRRLMRAQEAA